MKRSLEPITEIDLRRLGELARADRESMFRHNQRWRAYEHRLLGVALCQGAALHYIEQTNGVKDFDVWTFFARAESRPHPDPTLHRRYKRADFGDSRFGRTVRAPSWIKGRRVDLFARSLDVAPSADPVEAIQRWLSDATTTTARRLAEKAVVMIEPGLGQVIWPAALSRSSRSPDRPAQRHARPSILVECDVCQPPHG